VRSILYLGCPAAERADAERALAGANLAITWADNSSHALTELTRREMPLLIDLSRGAAALQVARDLRRARGDALMFAVVDPRRPDLTTEAVLTGLADVFARPLSGRRVANAIEREQHVDAASRTTRAAAEDLYCHSPAMREVAALVGHAASMCAGVAVRGEDGTGRQTVARAIHAAHGSGTFAAIDCAALGDDLEAALFGVVPRRSSSDPAGVQHERVARDSALFQALGGTLYLKNIGEAPALVQARLARVLRDREALLDGNDIVDLNIRPMAGVDADIDASLEEGRIREDLYRRLSVIRIDLPALRNRRDDIPALANYFVRDICGKERLPPKTLSRPALSLLAALPWRGNAAELRAVMEAIVLGAANGRAIGIDDVLAHVRLDGGASLLGKGGTLRQARARFEREYIASVLEQHHGRISDAAKALGIQRTNLYRKMRALKVIRERRR